MSQMCEPLQRKLSYYQMILLDDSNIGATRDSLKKNNLNIASLITTIKGNKFFIVDAPPNLGRILKDVKNILLFNYTNDDFLLLIEGIKSMGYNIDNFDLLGSQYFDTELSEKLENYSFSNDVSGYINSIRQNKIEITKFRGINGEKKIIFYRSGLIYSNLEISEINDLLVSILRKLNV